MYSNKYSINQFDITLDNILQRTTEYDIYQKYLGKFTVGTVYNCPYRKDKNPSFAIFKARNNNLLFKDFATGECGGIIKFVSKMTGLTNYNNILQRITQDLQLKNDSKPKVHREILSYETNIGIVRQPFTKSDIEYWSQFAITKKTLQLYNVFSIKYYLSNGIVKLIYHDSCPMYAYKVDDKFKIYRPYAADKRSKWRNNLTENNIQGYAQLPEKGDLLIITKSMKDVMCLYEMGFTAIASSSESTFIPERLLEILKKRFKRIIILYDRDVPGVRQSRNISLKTGLEAILVNKRFLSKDISDAVKTWGKTKIKNWLNKELYDKAKETR